MVDIEGALRYPIEDEDWLKPVGIGGLLLFLNFAVGVIGWFVVFFLGLITLGIGFLLFIPLVILQFVIFVVVTPLVLGYNVRVLRTTIRGGNRLPQFTRWGSLFKDGLYALAVSIVYMIPIVVLAGVFFLLATLTGFVGAAAGGSGAGDAVAAGGSLLFFLGQLAFMGISFVYGIAAWYFMPISLSIYAETESLGAAFSLDRLRNVGFTKEYALPWVIAVVGAMVVNNVAGFLTFLVVGAFLQFYVYIVMFRLFGLGYVAATTGGEGTPRGDPAGRAPESSGATYSER